MSDKVLNSDSSSFPKRSLIMTLDGLKDISLVEIGEYVLTDNGKLHKVLRKTSSLAQLLEIKGHGHPKFMATKEQKVLGTDYERVWSNETKSSERKFRKESWIDAEDMKSMFWASPVIFPQIKTPIEMSEDMAWLIGAYLDSGFIMYNGNIYFKTNDFRYEELQECLKRLNISFRKKDGAFIEFYISNAVLSDFFKRTFDLGYGIKNMPLWVYGMEEKYRKQLFEGFIWNNGSFGDNKYRIATKNKYLAIAIKLIAQSIGCSVALYLSVSKKDKKVVERWQLVAEINARSSAVMNNNRLGLVREISENKRKVSVYGLEIEENRGFIVDGIIVK